MSSMLDGYNLMHRGAIALAELESNGMRVDVDYLKGVMVKTSNRITRLEARLRDCPEYAMQRRRYGAKTNITSRDQLGGVLFGDMGHKPLAYTATGSAQLDETMLERIGTPYARNFLRLEKLNKLHGTYLKGVLREVDSSGFLHAFFGLHLVRSYRGQSDSPNLQNIPIRDAIQGPIIRKAFVPRQGHAIVEIDYSGAEVRVACSLSGDEKLTYDVLEGDMHRDMAAECYRLETKHVTKPVRQAAKGYFVFAEFYGDWYKQVAKNLWNGIERHKLTTADGVCLYKHLQAKGITERGACDPKGGDPRPGTFEAHIRDVEHSFWNKRFRVYHAKRRAWVDSYNKNGYIDMATGFRCRGPMTKNQVINYPIQGPSFHCLLWSLVQLVREVRRLKMGVKITCQIHDSIVADVPIGEVANYLSLAREITTDRLHAAWPWVTVPMVVEAEVAETNWFEKEKVEI